MFPTITTGWANRKFWFSWQKHIIVNFNIYLWRNLVMKFQHYFTSWLTQLRLRFFSIVLGYYWSKRDVNYPSFFTSDGLAEPGGILEPLYYDIQTPTNPSFQRGIIYPNLLSTNRLVDLLWSSVVITRLRIPAKDTCNSLGSLCVLVCFTVVLKLLNKRYVVSFIVL